MAFGGKLPPELGVRFDQEAECFERYKGGGSMINPVASSNVPLPQSTQTQNAAPAAKSAASQPPDTVHLSHASSAGDVDHDGDSH